MRAGRLMILVMVGVVAMTGCDTFQSNTTTSIDSIRLNASGKTITQDISLSDFDRVEAHHTFSLTVTQGDDFAVTLRVDEVVEPYLDVYVKDGTLVLTLDNENSYSLSGNFTMQAEITLPALVGLELSGASDAHLVGVESANAFNAKVSGASRVSGELVAGDVRIALSGSSRVALSGEAGDLDLDVSGASEVALGELPVENARVALSGSSNAELTVRGTLDAELSGASHVTYGEGTTLGLVETSGSSTVTAR